MPTHFDFGNQQVLVSGGASGIGAAIVQAFADSGARVLLVDRQAEAAERLAERLCAQGLHVDIAVADLSERRQIRQLIAGLERLDVLVHNAGYFPLRPLAELSEDDLQRTLAVNLGALVWLLQDALPLLAHSRGCALATSSVTGPRVAYPGLSHYAASKAGVNGFIRNAALELAPLGIRVNGVEPGMIRTPAMANLGDAAHTARIARGIPLGRLGEPDDIAQAMLFLASDSARYITGQTLIVDGGATLPEHSAS